MSLGLIPTVSFDVFGTAGLALLSDAATGVAFVDVAFVDDGFVEVAFVGIVGIVVIVFVDVFDVFDVFDVVGVVGVVGVIGCVAVIGVVGVVDVDAFVDFATFAATASCLFGTGFEGPGVFLMVGATAASFGALLAAFVGVAADLDATFFVAPDLAAFVLAAGAAGEGFTGALPFWAAREAVFAVFFAFDGTVDSLLRSHDETASPIRGRRTLSSVFKPAADFHPQTWSL